MTEKSPQGAPAWRAQSKYGLLRSDDTEAGRLVRLEDVALWMAAERPRDAVINALGSKLVVDEGEGATYLYIVNARDYAKRLIENGRPSPRASSFWQFLPETYGDSSAEVVARDIAESWFRVWPGLADLSTDHEWRFQRNIARNLEHAANSDVGRERGDVVLSWPEDDFLMGLLQTVAIPLVKAGELWGFGLEEAATNEEDDLLRGQGTVPLDESQPNAVVPAPPDPAHLETFEDLVRYRAKVLPGMRWDVGKQLTVLNTEYARLGGTPAAYPVLAKALGRSRQSIKKTLEAVRKRPETGGASIGIENVFRMKQRPC
ncbi:MAG: hypothetical protein JWM47_4429 [Acidimicrobiales bacterium]|nr:hypothetical protein [Acidimicrobiales bacterium]